MRKIGATTEEAVGALVPPRQTAKAPAFLRAEGRIYRLEAAKLRALLPPAEVASDHKELIREDLQTARDYQRLAAAVEHRRQGKPPSVSAIIGSLPRSFRVLSDYRSKGYNLGSFTGD